MLMVLSTNADSKDKHCVDAKKNGGEKFQVSCEEEGAVISDITVFSGTTDSCTENAGCCVGETPNLIVESLNCYWKQNCSISFPRDIIIKSYADCSNCIGSQPRFMMIKETRCFTPKNTTDGHVQQDIVDICEELKPEPSDISMDSGLLLSHKYYPWEYKPSKMMSAQDPTRTCNKKFWLKDHTTMVVSVHTIDVAEGDSLLVINGSLKQTIQNKTTLVFHAYQTRSVEFTFTVAQESNGGRGFVLCFKMIPTRSYDSTMNACDDVMNESAAVKVTKADAECTRTWWGCPTPTPTPTPPPKKEKKRCRKKDRKANKCKNRNKQKGQKKKKKNNKERRNKKRNGKGSNSSKQRRSRKQS